MNTQRNIPDYMLGEEVIAVELETGNESLRVDPKGFYHRIKFMSLLDGKRVLPPEEFDGDWGKWLESIGIPDPVKSPRVSTLIVVTDLSFPEAAKWCARNLVPEPFDDYLIARV
jgi:hypothetical protein